MAAAHTQTMELGTIQELYKDFRNLLTDDPGSLFVTAILNRVA